MLAKVLLACRAVKITALLYGNRGNDVLTLVLHQYRGIGCTNLQYLRKAFPHKLDRNDMAFQELVDVFLNGNILFFGQSDAILLKS